LALDKAVWAINRREQKINAFVGVTCRNRS
jgi:hypothetical protein